MTLHDVLAKMICPDFGSSVSLKKRIGTSMLSGIPAPSRPHSRCGSMLPLLEGPRFASDPGYDRATAHFHLIARARNFGIR